MVRQCARRLRLRLRRLRRLWRLWRRLQRRRLWRRLWRLRRLVRRLVRRPVRRLLRRRRGRAVGVRSGRLGRRGSHAGKGMRGRRLLHRIPRRHRSGRLLMRLRVRLMRRRRVRAVLLLA